MTIQTTYSNARAHLAQLWDEVTQHQEVVVITRRGSEDVAMIAASELASLLETAHLLRSPKNARRLLTALNRALEDSPRQAETIAEFRQGLQLDEKKA